jgi:ubiquinol-cytochrome c reductase cytochrome b subunit
VNREAVPFHPYYTAKDGFALVVFGVLFAYFVFYMPNYLGHADNYVEANALVTPPHIVPEWYFLPFYAILRAIPSKLGGVIAMFGAIAVLFLVPWLDTSRVRSTRYRPLYRWFFWLLVITCLALGYLGAKAPEGGYLIAGRLFTAYYFLHFLVIMPLIGIIETPKPQPRSIAESVLGPSRGGGHMPHAAPAAAEKR